jgi:hypothetical protein
LKLCGAAGVVAVEVDEVVTVLVWVTVAVTVLLGLVIVVPGVVTVLPAGYVLARR